METVSRETALRESVSLETVSRETAPTSAAESVSPPESPLTPWFVTGFVQASGCFTFSRSGRQLALYFSLKSTARDVALLHDLQRFFGGAGRIYPLPATRGCLYRVSRHDELDRLLDHFDAWPLLASKAAAYALWRQMVVLKRNFRDPPRRELDALAEQLSLHSRARTAAVEP